MRYKKSATECLLCRSFFEKGIANGVEGSGIIDSARLRERAAIATLMAPDPVKPDDALNATKVLAKKLQIMYPPKSILRRMFFEVILAFYPIFRYNKLILFTITN